MIWYNLAVIAGLNPQMQAERRASDASVSARKDIDTVRQNADLAVAGATRDRVNTVPSAS
jgi:hypothetical protein